MLKGIGISSIVKLVLAVMIASLFISISTIGALGGALQESFDNIGQVTDYTSEIENGEQLSHLALFVRDRAVGCDHVIERNEGTQLDGVPESGEEGYPGLSHIDRLGQKPSCFGGDATIIRDKYDWVWGRGTFGGGPDENHMRGIYSRERFEITEEAEDGIFISETRASNDAAEYWLDSNLGGVSGRSFSHHIDQDSLDDRGDGYRGSGRNYVVFFEEPDIGEERTSMLIENANNYESAWGSFDTHVWSREYDLSSIGNDANWPVSEHNFNVMFCPGDKGYIQMSTGYPHNDGMSDAHGSDDYYPRIVVEESEMETCGALEEEKDYSGPNRGQQLWIHAAAEHSHGFTPSAIWPEAYGFRLRGGEQPEESRSTWKASLELENDACQIYYRQRRTGQHNREFVTVRSYDLGTIVEKNHDTFRAGGGFNFVEEDHRGLSAQAWDLFNAMSNDEETSGTGLDGRKLTENVGELRVSTTASTGYNRLHGDLLCENPNNRDYGEWHVCNKNLNEKTIGGWSCDPEEGEWS